MDFNEYTNGKRTIKATVVTYEGLYKAQGYKPVTKSTVRRGSGNVNNVKADKVGAEIPAESGADSVLGGEIDI